METQQRRKNSNKSKTTWVEPSKHIDPKDWWFSVLGFFYKNIVQKKKILHIQTGWTITWNVPEYWEIEKLANLFTDYVDIWKYIVHSFQASCEYSTIKVCNKDSREILDIDRQRIVDEINKAYKNGIKNFFVTHGTFTMPDTWIYISENLAQEILSDVSIVLTWAMYPWGVLWSDAPMNIWATISTLLNADWPIWLTMSMHWKNWNVYKVEKDTENLIFHD